MKTCTKRKFKTLAQAEARLQQIADDPRYGPRPRFAYRCKVCGWVHLTKSDANYTQRQADRLLFAQQYRILLEAQYWLRRLMPKRVKH